MPADRKTSTAPANRRDDPETRPVLANRRDDPGTRPVLANRRDDPETRPVLANRRDEPGTERDPGELFAGPAYNPAFDVTPADLVTAVVTEQRTVRPSRGEHL